MSKKINRQEEYNNLLVNLKDLNIQELLLLFIEAKTGSHEEIDNLPVTYLEAIDELGDMLNELYADRVIDKLFK